MHGEGRTLLISQNQNKNIKPDSYMKWTPWMRQISKKGIMKKD